MKPSVRFVVTKLIFYPCYISIVVFTSKCLQFSQSTVTSHLNCIKDKCDGLFLRFIDIFNVCIDRMSYLITLDVYFMSKMIAEFCKYEGFF